jgi:hypothetical protein
MSGDLRLPRRHAALDEFHKIGQQHDQYHDQDDRPMIGATTMPPLWRNQPLFADPRIRSHALRSRFGKAGVLLTEIDRDFELVCFEKARATPL